MQLVLKELQGFGLEKTELILRKPMELIWDSLQVVIIFRILVNLIVAFIMGMEHLVIITIIWLQKWEISLMEPQIQIIMALPLFLNNNQNLLWLMLKRKLKCKNLQ